VLISVLRALRDAESDTELGKRLADVGIGNYVRNPHRMLPNEAFEGCHVALLSGNQMIVEKEIGGNWGDVQAFQMRPGDLNATRFEEIEEDALLEAVRSHVHGLLDEELAKIEDDQKFIKKPLRDWSDATATRNLGLVAWVQVEGMPPCALVNARDPLCISRSHNCVGGRLYNLMLFDDGKTLADSDKRGVLISVLQALRDAGSDTELGKRLAKAGIGNYVRNMQQKAPIRRRSCCYS
jgi:hypothetical protein